MVTKMEIKSFECYNEKSELEIDPINWLKYHYGNMNSVIKYLTEFKSEFVDEYIQNLNQRIEDAVKSIKKKDSIYELPNIEDKFEFLDKHLELKKLTKELILAHLNPMKKSEKDPAKYIVFSYNRSMSLERISYYRVKSFVELLGKEEGIKLYTKIITRIQEDDKSGFQEPSDVSITKNRENAIKSWCRIGLCDFTYGVLDEHKTIYRFDKCFTHEVLKDLNDPDIAYYASCYRGDLPTRNDGLIICMKRTQTLHHGDFCDELYWDSRVHKNPEQPTLEFTRKLGRE